MKIEINIKLFLLIVISCIFNNFEMYSIFIIFAIIHEIAHFIFGIFIGGKTEKIKIEPYGISLVFNFNQKNNSFIKVMFYLIGPFTNLLIAILFLKNNILFVELQTQIIYTNLLLFAFNLLPIIPLDGGKIVIEIVRLVYKDKFEVKKVLFISKFFLYIISFFYSIIIVKIKNIYILLLIIHLWYLYYVEEKKIMLYDKTIKIINKYN